MTAEKIYEGKCMNWRQYTECKEPSLIEFVFIQFLTQKAEWNLFRQNYSQILKIFPSLNTIIIK